MIGVKKNQLFPPAYAFHGKESLLRRGTGRIVRRRACANIVSRNAFLSGQQK
jgi:hypothetical protein